MQPSDNTADLWKRAAPIGLLGGLCVLVSNTPIAGSHLEKPRLLRETGWSGSDSTSENEERIQLHYDTPTASGLEEPTPGPLMLRSTLTRDETEEPDRMWGQSAFEALGGLEGYSDDNWDMEGARAITSEVIRIAASLLQRLPEEASPPDIAPAADGTVCMEWVTPSGLLWLDVGSDRTAWILTKIDGVREEKRLPVDGKDFRSCFRTALERLYPPTRGKGFRALFVAP